LRRCTNANSQRNIKPSTASLIGNAYLALPGVKKDRPFDDLGLNENTLDSPRIGTKQLMFLLCIARVHDEQGPAVICVGPGQNDSPLVKQTINERNRSAGQTGAAAERTIC
jgi:hypothetical protein